MDHKIGKQLNVHLIKVAHLNYCRENSALRQYKCVHTRCCISLTDLKDQYKFINLAKPVEIFVTKLQMWCPEARSGCVQAPLVSSE